MIEINTPYVKVYDSNGNVSNPIVGSYPSLAPNRKQRRAIKQKNRFYGESKNYHLTCDGINSYARIKQYSINKEGNKKVVLHYLVR